MSKEIRTFEIGGIEERDGEPPQIWGYASVFDRETDLGSFREVVRRGAFADYLKGSGDVVALLNHDANHVLGRRSASTLRLWEDVTGLKVQIAPPDTQSGRDTLALIKRGDIKGMSFGFRTKKDAWDYQRKDMPLRELLQVDLFDVSAVTYPAYPDTSVAARSLEEAVKSGVIPVDVLLRELALEEAA